MSYTAKSDEDILLVDGDYRLVRYDLSTRPGGINVYQFYTTLPFGYDVDTVKPVLQHRCSGKHWAGSYTPYEWSAWLAPSLFNDLEFLKSVLEKPCMWCHVAPTPGLQATFLLLREDLW